AMPGRKWPLDAPEKFYRLSDKSLARYQNASFLGDFALRIEHHLDALSHLGPLRDPPRRVYGWSGNTPESVGSKGEYAVAAILAAEAQGRALSRGPRQREQRFAAFIARWLEDLGVIQSFEVQRMGEGRKEHEVKVKTLGG